MEEMYGRACGLALCMGAAAKNSSSTVPGPSVPGEYPPAITFMKEEEEKHEEFSQILIPQYGLPNGDARKHGCCNLLRSEKTPYTVILYTLRCCV